MEFWNEILNSAMLGAGKKMPDPALLPDALKEQTIFIQEQPLDREEQFLQVASLAFNYRQCGVKVLQMQEVSMARAPQEEKRYCSGTAMQALYDIFDDENLALLRIWLGSCYKAGQLAEPAVLPLLLNFAARYKKLRTEILSVCGKRGQWLCSFNKEWNFSVAETSEEIWLTGALEQRKQVLSELRKNDAALALAWLQQTWKQEDANTKMELLAVLETNAGASDIPFLESLSGENSKKVRALAISLLKKIPGSAILQQYGQIVQEALQLKNEKILLGLGGNNKVLHIRAPEVDEPVFSSGIEKLSPDKTMSDDIYILYQLMQYVPLSLYEQWWQLKPQEIIGLFQHDKTVQQLFPALVLSCTRFRDIRWGLALMQHSKVFYLDLLPLLPIQQQEFYSIKFFADNPVNVLRYALEREDEWSVELTAKIFAFAAKNPYQYNRGFFSQHIHLVPERISGQLDQFTPAEEHLRGPWNNSVAQIIKLLQLKKQVKESFK